MRASDGNVSDGLVDFEKLKAVRRKLLAQDGGDLEREPALILPDLANQALQLRATQGAGCSAAQGVGLHLFDDVFLVDFAEMFFHGLHAAQAERLGHVQANVFGCETLFLGPLFNHLLITHNSNAGLVHLERHSGEALGVEFAELVLVIVVVGRAENLPA